MKNTNLNLYDGATFEHAGRTFLVNFEQDVDAGLPWNEEEGHGPVRKSSRKHYDGDSNKHPGERPMNSPDRNEYQFYYDWQGAIKRAQIEGCGLCEEDIAELTAKLGKAPTKRQIIAESVRRDFEFCSYCINDEMPYVGVIVKLIRYDRNDERVDVAEDAIWRVETFDDYHMACAYEVADGIMYERRQQWHKALKEARERRYWLLRGVETKAA